MTRNLQNNESSDSSDESVETYIPESVNQELIVDDSVYDCLEYINVEWPSQTISIFNNYAFIGTNPTTDKPSLVRINLSSTQNFTCPQKTEFASFYVNENINRIRASKSLIGAVSDNIFSLYKAEGDLQFKSDGKYSYGLAQNEDSFYVGCQDGAILHFFNGHSSEISKFHTSKVESISVYQNILYSSGCDAQIVAADIRAKQQIFTIENDCDINSVDYRDNILISGDDHGILKSFDIRMPDKPQETILWHKSPISMVRWKSDSEFYSLSDEQVCLWDTEMIEDWKFHKWLTFVHAGQKFYKDIEFWNEHVLTTSQDGICVFKLDLENKLLDIDE